MYIRLGILQIICTKKENCGWYDTKKYSADDIYKEGICGWYDTKKGLCGYINNY